ncbi:MAG: sorbosone dehydrogenase [Sphingomonas sp. SCN 67-18]|uniref:PQQ-dependent sugar dehydrogenase n=1 Tax=uncultured Sphingomonas sp. TaxID=158754 RepID=UPI00086C9CA9|nr:sorbosone dehydrogenase family protein [Sphingomonas sp. SCN 67-18]ODU20983.1 MAG: sorbosone dehydrogenase [Sphingomonas sp. SCN 67-18]
MPSLLRKTLIGIGLVIFAIAIMYLILTRGQDAKLSVDAVTGPKPTIATENSEFIPNVDVAPVDRWRDGAKPAAGAGLAVNEFAAGLDHPRWMTVLPNGDVLVAETNSPPRPVKGIADWVMGKLLGRAGAGVPSANRITLLRDSDGDGTADQKSVLLSGLNSPFGMALIGDRLYVANTDAVVAFPFTVGQTRISAPAEKIVALPGGGNHWARNIIANPAGTLLYVTVGSSSNIAEKGLDVEENRANILEVDLASKSVRIFAGGLRNPNGLDFEPTTGGLWTTVNERDMLGGDLAPDYMTRVEFGAFYGWPYSYWGGYVDKRVQPERPDLLEYTKRPDYALGAHTAPLGLVFASGDELGARFANGAFVGLHGSWNRTPPSGYKVIFVPFGDNGYPNGKPVDVLTGFLSAKGKAQGRPVGVAMDKQGALLVADDVGNRIWRVTAAR